MLRAYVDEIAVERFVFADLRPDLFAPSVCFLRDPGGREAGRTAADGADNASECSDERRVHELCGASCADASPPLAHVFQITQGDHLFDVAPE